MEKLGRKDRMCFFSNGEVFSEALKHISHHITLVRTVPVSKPIASRGNGFSPDWLAEGGFQQNKIRPLGTRRDRKRPRFALLLLLRFALLLLLSLFSRVRLCATPETAAHQAPPSLGFSRQEHWSGLPSPSPMHESEKGK